MGFKGIFTKTTALGFLIAIPAAILARILGGPTVMYGVIIGFLIALANVYASMGTIMNVSGERPASSIMLVMFSFPIRMVMIVFALFLVAKTGAINVFATVVTLVVVYTVFAFSEFSFASLRGHSQSNS